jgi:hypothetical protein
MTANKIIILFVVPKIHLEATFVADHFANTTGSLGGRDLSVEEL